MIVIDDTSFEVKNLGFRFASLLRNDWLVSHSAALKDDHNQASASEFHGDDRLEQEAEGTATGSRYQLT